VSSAQRAAGPLFRGLSIVLVSAWLLVALCWLLLRGRVDGRQLRLWLRSKFRRRYRGPLGTIWPEGGYCHKASVPRHLLSDRDGLSSLVVLEDGRPLQGAGALHDEIRQLGCGRYSHWGDTLYFSTSDNSDPAGNGRAYWVEER
jgi:hypothetical protein